MNTLTQTKDLAQAGAAGALEPHFAQVPLIVLPNSLVPGGIEVAPFKVGQFHFSKDADGRATVSPTAVPWVDITFIDAVKACEGVNRPLITELQYIAIAYDIASVDVNWTGGKVGVGKVFQGLHLGTVRGGQRGDYESPHPEERRWHQLSNGSIVYDFAGHLFSFTRDNIQGDARGLVARPFAADSPSIATAPYPSMRMGMGWRPRAEDDWSGLALIRGGCWDDRDGAGVFDLYYLRPSNAVGGVGFRGTIAE